MADKYADLRAALDAGPTPGPWFADEHGKIWRRSPKELYENGGGVAGDRALATANVGWHGEGCVGFPAKANASLIAAANPEAIRARGQAPAQTCCKGGPQWGHAWDCKELP